MVEYQYAKGRIAQSIEYRLQEAKESLEEAEILLSRGKNRGAFIISAEVAKFLDIAFRRGTYCLPVFSGAPTFMYSSARLQFVKI